MDFARFLHPRYKDIHDDAKEETHGWGYCTAAYNTLYTDIQRSDSWPLHLPEQWERSNDFQVHILNIYLSFFLFDEKNKETFQLQKRLNFFFLSLTEKNPTHSFRADRLCLQTMSRGVWRWCGLGRKDLWNFTMNPVGSLDSKSSILHSSSTELSPAFTRNFIIERKKEVWPFCVFCYIRGSAFVRSLSVCSLRILPQLWITFFRRTYDPGR